MEEFQVEVTQDYYGNFLTEMHPITALLLPITWECFRK